MKVLFVNLLRLGDVLMTAPILSAWRRAHPESEIDVLINDQAEAAVPFLPVRRAHLFRRGQLQKLLADEDASIFEAHDSLFAFVQSLNGEKYDLIVNLTQNRLSGFLCKMLKAKDKLGMVLDAQDKVEFGQKWFRYLNSPLSEKIPFHYNDIFLNALGLTSECPSVDLQRMGDEILIQTSSSDGKKVWSQNQTKDLVHQLLTMGHKVVLLGSPAETETLASFSQHPRLEIFAAGLLPTFERLRNARLLISFDTSIKHLGVLAKIPILELALGSADPRKTGAYISGALVVRSNVNCAPCSHLNPCFQPTHQCAESFSVETIAKIAESYLQNKNQFSIPSTINVLKTSLEGVPFFSLEPLEQLSHLKRLVEQTAVRVLLSDVDRFDTTGTESYRLLKTLSERKAHEPEVMRRALALLAHRKVSDGDQALKTQVSNVVTNFVSLRRRQDEALTLKRLAEIESRLIRSLNNHFTEIWR